MRRSLVLQEKNFSVILIDDDIVDVMNVQRALEKNGLTIKLYTAENGLEALRMLRGDGYDSAISKPVLLLLDLNMPKMNGIEFLKELRADPDLKELIVIVLTTSNDKKDIARAYSFNVAGYILKPLSFDTFTNIIKTIYDYWQINELPW